jgi:hypothetical protein
MSWYARGAPVDFHFHGTVGSRINNNLFLLTIQLTKPFVRGRIFWAFNLHPAVEGSNIDPAKILNHGVIREPAPFQFRVCPRHPDVERIIESESAYADLHLKEWEY